MDTKVCLAIVTNRGIRPKTANALLSLVANSPVFPVVASEGYTIAEGRNYCVYQAMKNQCTHILFIDDDMTFPPDTLDRLLLNETEIVGVNSQSRTLPLSTTVSLLKDGEHWPHSQVPPYWEMPKETFEVYSIGMGVALIDMKVFDTIEKPWFKFTANDDGKILVGEDAWFCQQARAKDYKIWCDPTIPIGHLGEYEYATYNEEKRPSYIIENV